MKFTRPAFLLVFVAMAQAAGTSRAGITNFDVFGNQQYTQTANNTAPSGTPLYFFASRLFYNTPGDVTAALGVTAASFSYTPQVGNFALFQTPFITQDLLINGYLPLTTPLIVNITGGNLAPLFGRSQPLGNPLFTSAVPYLTGNSYNQLQSLNASAPDTITFPGFSPVAGSNESDIFLSIRRTSDNAAVLPQVGLSNAATSFTILANTLAAGTAYNLEVDYSSRLNSLGSFGTVNTPFTAGYDVRTEIAFTTAPLASVPEPASLALSAIGAASAFLGFRARRRPS